MHIAASHGEREMLLLLLDGGAVADGRDASGMTALHDVAASTLAAPCAHLLLERGARKDSVDGMGRTPLQVLEQRGAPHERDTEAQERFWALLSALK